MQTLSKSIVNDAQFRTIAHAARHSNDRTPLNVAFKAVSYADHAQTYNARTVRAVNLLLPQVSVSDGNIIRYSALQTTVNNAAITPQGSTSLESDYAWTVREALPVRISHHSFCTRESLTTAELAENVISSGLLAGIENKTDDVLLNSTNPLSLGLRAMAALSYTQTTSIHAALLQAAVQIRAANVDAPMAVVPNLAVLDSASFLAFRSETDTSGRYIVNPEAQDVYLWGLRVVESPQLPTNTGLVLDTNATLVVKTALDSGVRTSDSHEELFARGIVTLLGEVRTAVLCYNPRAISQLTLL